MLTSLLHAVSAARFCWLVDMSCGLLAIILQDIRVGVMLN